jgi:carbon monoxide dehydrogenase subunit G
MELINEFEVSVPPEVAWAVFTDVEKIAPCLPGAQLKEIDGDEYRGVVKVKVGPITASYQGVANFEELDVEARRVVLKAVGRDTRGQGNASALITAQMSASERGTLVKVSTDLSITGKVAQFGRGVLDDVSAKLLAQFVENLEATVLAPGDAIAEVVPPLVPETAATEVAQPEATGPRVVDQGEVEPVDLFGLAGGSVMRRFGPYLAGAGLILVAVILILVLA